MKAIQLLRHISSGLQGDVIFTAAFLLLLHIMTHNFVEVFGRFNVTICLTARESPRRPIL